MGWKKKVSERWYKERQGKKSKVRRYKIWLCRETRVKGKAMSSENSNIFVNKEIYE